MPACTSIPASFRFGLRALAACLAFGSAPASAETASFGIPPQAVFVDGGAVIGAALVLPHTGNPAFLITFVLPRDYADDRPVRIVIYLSSQMAAPCQIRFTAPQMVRKRAGANLVNNVAGISGGSPTVSFPEGQFLVAKVFTLSPGGPMAGQRRSDIISVQFRRHADDTSDTCAPVYVQGIDIRYPLLP